MGLAFRGVKKTFIIRDDALLRKSVGMAGVGQIALYQSRRDIPASVNQCFLSATGMSPLPLKCNLPYARHGSVVNVVQMHFLATSHSPFIMLR